MKNDALIFKIMGFFVMFLAGALSVYAGYKIAAAMTPSETGINQYTPIMILLAIVLYESTVFVIFAARYKFCKKSQRPVASEKGCIQSLGSTQKTADNLIENFAVEDKVDAVFDENIVRELFARQYTIEQITAMMHIVPYIKDIQADLLIKMFGLDMSPEEIGQYIEMFYG